MKWIGHIVLVLSLPLLFSVPDTATADASAKTLSHLASSFDQSRTQSPVSGELPCAYLEIALRAAERRVELDQGMRQSTSAYEHDPASKEPSNRAASLEVDLAIVEHGKAELDKCMVWDPQTATKRGPTSDCTSYRFIEFHAAQRGRRMHDVPIWRDPESYDVFYESEMTIDADGAPNAYHPENIGLDELSNAGAPGFWEALAEDMNGDPYIQGPNDPFPGYFVSTTDLVDRTKARSDPARYVDATRIPYIVLPSGTDTSIAAHPGDFAIVFNLQNLKSSPAIFADTGPPNHLGEGSIALAKNLGLWADARRGGTTRGILYLIFPGSGDGHPRSIEEIQAQAERLFETWGGYARLAACGIR